MGSTAWRTCSCCGNLFYWVDRAGDLDFATNAKPAETLEALERNGYGSFNRGGMDFGMVGTRVDVTRVPADFVAFVAEHRGEVVGVRDGEVLSAFKTAEDAEQFKNGLQGRTFEFVETSDDMCEVCRVRGGLCLHNLSQRQEAAGEGAGRVPYHSTSPHESDEFAGDPDSCPPCNEARRRAEWRRRVESNG